MHTHPTSAWRHAEIGVSNIELWQIVHRLDQVYRARSWGEQTRINDLALLKRVCNGRHPDEVTLPDMEAAILRASAPSTRANYIARLKSIWATMRELEITESTVDRGLPRVRKPRSVPKPLTPEEAQAAMMRADDPMRDWFVLACKAGLRAAEVARVRGEHLTDLGGGRFDLRILGKGATDLTVPVHEDVAAMIARYKTFGPLWPGLTPKKVSTLGGMELRRLGVPPGRARFHAARHYFATSVLEASGWDLLTTSKLMRHASVTTTTGYTLLRDDRPREVLAALA